MTMMKFCQLLLIIFVLFLFKHCYAKDIEREMTIEVRPGAQECFYQEVKEEDILDIEYQVIDGGQGELDINFHIAGPKGNVIIKDKQKSDSAHRTTVKERGDYRICFDNSFSRFNTKTVFFGVLVENENEDDDDWDYSEDTYRPEDVYEMKVEDIKDAILRIRNHLSRSRFMQDQLRAFEARDRNIAENNYSRVNNMSMVNLSVMIFTGLIQVILLRSLFDEKSRLHGMWKKRSQPYM